MRQRIKAMNYTQQELLVPLWKKRLRLKGSMEEHITQLCTDVRTEGDTDRRTQSFLESLYRVKQGWSTNRCVLSTCFQLNSSISELKRSTNRRTDGPTDGQTLLQRCEVAFWPKGTVFARLCVCACVRACLYLFLKINNKGIWRETNVWTATTVTWSTTNP